MEEVGEEFHRISAEGGDVLVMQRRRGKGRGIRRRWLVAAGGGGCS